MSAPSKGPSRMSNLKIYCHHIHFHNIKTESRTIFILWLRIKQTKNQMSVHIYTHEQVPTKVRRGSGSPRAGGTSSCEMEPEPSLVLWHSPINLFHDFTGPKQRSVSMGRLWATAYYDKCFGLDVLWPPTGFLNIGSQLVMVLFWKVVEGRGWGFSGGGHWGSIAWL